MDADDIARARRAEPAWDDLREQRVLGRVLAARRKPARSWQRTAGFATLAAAAVALFAWSQLPAAPTPVVRAPEPITPTPIAPTTPDETPRLALADGSEVELGADANVEVEAQEPTEVRLVQRAGDARYVVSHRPERSFVVRVGDVSVTVRGTIFVVRVEAPTVEVVVEEGRVEVARRDETHMLGVGESVQLAMLAPIVEAPVEATTTETPEVIRPASLPHAPRTPSAPAPLGMTELLARANGARSDGRLDEAADTLRLAVSSYPDDERVLTALFTLGRVERSRGRDRASAEAFERVVAHDPDAVLAEDALAEGAVSWMAAGRADRARTLATQYLERFPEGTYAGRMRSLVPQP